MRLAAFIFLSLLIINTMTGCNSESEIKTDKTKELFAVVHLKIHDGKLDEFKSLAKQCIQIVEEKGKGTIQYDWYFNENQTECVILEKYSDSDAVLQHSENVGEPLGKLLALCYFSSEVYGEPSAELLKATEGSGLVIYKYFKGLK